MICSGRLGYEFIGCATPTGQASRFCRGSMPLHGDIHVDELEPVLRPRSRRLRAILWNFGRGLCDWRLYDRGGVPDPASSRPALLPPWKGQRVVPPRLRREPDLLDHTDYGGTQFNFSEISGNSAAAAISNAYYADNRKATDAVWRLGTQIGGDMTSNILKEFWPDIYRKFKRIKTAQTESDTWLQHLENSMLASIACQAWSLITFPSWTFSIPTR
jgi:hypothetical protein